MSNSDNISSFEAVIFDQFALFPTARLLEFNGTPLTVGSRAIEILSLLLERAGTVVSKRDLIIRAWPHASVNESGLKVQIASLRKILKDGQNGNRYIVNASGRGYSFVAPIERKTIALRAALESVPSPQTSSRLSTILSDDETLRNRPMEASEPKLVTIERAEAISIVEQIVSTFKSAMQVVGQNDNDSVNRVSDVRSDVRSTVAFKHQDHVTKRLGLTAIQANPCPEMT